MESFLACSTKPQVLTTATSASAASSTRRQPSAASRPASSSESTSLRVHPRVTSATLPRRSGGEGHAATLDARWSWPCMLGGSTHGLATPCPRAATCSPSTPSSTGTTTCRGRRASRSATTSTGLDIGRPGARRRTPTCPRLREGGVGAQFWSVFVPSDAAGRRRRDRRPSSRSTRVHRHDRAGMPTELALATTADEVEAAMRARAGSPRCMGAEGGHSIDCSLGALRMLHAPRRALPDPDPQRQRRRGPTRRPTCRSLGGLTRVRRARWCAR